jgi:two-component system CheB/CheR fusion protein
MPKKSDTESNVTIVAIGASAGGLDPYERFFDNTKDDSGVAYVIIQHLSPNFQSMMDELLSRHSKMKIERVVNELTIEPNTIYLNPPRTEMTVKNGKFQLTDYSETKLLNLPIDTFFSSLAQEAGSKAIAVILSGTGSDGTKGAQEIKDSGGIVLAQDLTSAKFDGMPGSVIKLGIADAVGYPEMLAENVGRILKGQPLIADPHLGVIKNPSQRIFHQLRERYGTEFNYYKTATIDRRLERRASLLNLSLEDYAAVVANDPAEAEAVYGDLLIEVTSFFRDPDAFEALRTKVVPSLASDMSKTRPIRIWVPGCASGEEAYSIAIMFADYARLHGLDLQLKILATDIHHRSLDAASTGIYPRSSLGGLSQDQLDRYFDVVDDKYQIKTHLRRMVVFSPHNILKDPPFTRMDLITCRNVLIYFNDVAQQKTLALFHFAMRKSGFLFLGPSETTGKLEAEFSIVDAKWRIVQKRRDVRLMESVSMLPPTGVDRDSPIEQNLRLTSTITRSAPSSALARQAHNDSLKEMLRRYAPPGILLNAHGEIAHVFGDAGEFLKIESGVFSNRIVDLVSDELKMIVSSGLERVRTANKLKFERRVTSFNDELGSHSIVVRIETISQDDAQEIFTLLTMERIKPDGPAELPHAPVEMLGASEAASMLHGRIDDLERDLHSTEESLQATIEELETSNEELQATNEELMASNEELQSTNEELHSVNEELYTVSTEHQRKIEELMEATDDMDHLLRATNIGIIFLDEKLQIRRFTPSAKDAFNILNQDVGRPIDHVTYRFQDFGLNDVIKSVHRAGQVHESEVVVDERTYVLRVLPYRSSLDEIMGLVITTVDITEIKMAEHARTQTTRRYEAIVGDLTDFLLRWSPKDNKVSYANQTLADVLDQPLEDIIDQDISKIGGRGRQVSIFANLNHITEDTTFENQVIRYDASGKEVYVSGKVRPIFGEDGTIERMQATGSDVTAQFNYRNALEKLLQLRETAVVGHEMSLVDDLLEVGREYLDMPRGALGRFSGDTLEILNLQGQQPFEVGDLIPMSSTVGQLIHTKNEIYAYEDFENTPIAGTVAQKKMDVRAYISITVNTAKGAYGRVAFADSNPKARPFSPEEHMFIRLLANSIETLIERNEFLRDIEYRRQHYVNVYDQAPIMRCTLDDNGAILEANAVWLETLGYKANECVGVDFTKFVSGGELKRDWPAFPKLLKSDKGKRTATVTFGTNTKGVVVCELTATLLKEPSSGEDHYLISMIDVTERNRSFERIEKQKQELEKANEGLSTFAYVASHDLQEPLRKIRQYVEMLEIDCKDALDEQGSYYLDVITGSAARISYLVKDILVYTTASNADIEITDLHLNDIVDEVIEEVSDQITHSNAEISVGKLPSTRGDWGAVRLLFQNLLSNGIKYQTKGAKPAISVKSRALKSSYVIDVTDNGIGIDDIKGKDVFEPFVRLHSKFEYAGTGIGLAICKAVCDRMNWDIDHKPNPKGGTTFSIVIPK